MNKTHRKRKFAKILDFLKKQLSFKTPVQKYFLSTHFMSLVYSYTPWKHQKIRGALIFSGDIEEKSSMKGLTGWIKIFKHPEMGSFWKLLILS